jgi:hypothetical protein
MYSLRINDVDDKSYCRCGSLNLGSLNVNIPIKTLNPSEFRALKSLSLPIPKTILVKTIHLNPIDLSVLARKGKVYKNKVRSFNALSRQARADGGEFLLVPHLNKKTFKSIETKVDFVIGALTDLQIDSNSSAIVIPDYWKYTSNDYKQYFRQWSRKTGQLGKPTLATLLPSEKESRIKKRLEEILPTVDGVLVNMSGDVNHTKFATTFNLLLKERGRTERIWIHGYESPNRVSDMLCAEQIVLPLVGSDSMSLRESHQLPPKVREKLALKNVPRCYDSSTNGILNKEEYVQHHHGWECREHVFCQKETLDSIYAESTKLRGHNILGQIIMVGNMFDWVGERNVLKEMKDRMFSKEFVQRNTLLEGGLRRWAG